MRVVSLTVDFEELSELSNDEVIEFEVPDRDKERTSHYRTKHFAISYLPEDDNLIIHLKAYYETIFNGKLSEYDENITIADISNGDVYTVEELFHSLFDG